MVIKDLTELLPNEAADGFTIHEGKCLAGHCMTFLSIKVGSIPLVCAHFICNVDIRLASGMVHL